MDVYEDMKMDVYEDEIRICSSRSSSRINFIDAICYDVI